MIKRIDAVMAGMITTICIVAFVLISIRLFAKEVLVDAIGIRNETISFLADFTWGDQLSKYQEKQISSEFTDEYYEIREIYDSAILNSDNENENESTAGDEKRSVLNRYEKVVSEVKSDINDYCNRHFILRPYLTDIRIKANSLLHWDMAYARNDGDEYMLHNGVVDRAVSKAKTQQTPDLSVKNAADKNNARYIYLQFPYRVTHSDSYVPYGAENKSNENADDYLDLLRANGVTVLDLRKELESIGWDNHEGYYLTDSHWTTDTGFKASGIISKFLSDNCDEFVYYPKHHDAASYEITSVDLKNPMVRERVNLYLPGFDANLRFICLEDEKEYDIESVGGFTESIFDMKKAEPGHFSNVLSAYSVSMVGKSLLTETKNEGAQAKTGTVLFISNSFSWYIIPYLALDCDKVVFLHIDARDCAAGVIEELKPDVVIEAPF